MSVTKDKVVNFRVFLELFPAENPQELLFPVINGVFVASFFAARPR